jgi:hypothetical protein
MNAAEPRETLSEKIARLKDGRWHASESPQQATGDIWRKAPGGPPVRTRGRILRARVFRHPAGGGRVEIDFCEHNHTSHKAAQTCAGKEANRRNREEKRQL